jgi:proline racemase
MQEKRLYFSENLDHIRKRITREPRGHNGMFTAVVTDPVTAGADFGLIYMDPRRYPFLCGHATIGAVTTLIKVGALKIKNGVSTVTVDTPSGPMETGVKVANGQAESVTLKMVPSFVYETGKIIHLPETGDLSVETVCVGGFFVMVNASQIKIPLEPQSSSRLISLGMKLIDAANGQLSVKHPARPEVNTIDVVEFYDDPRYDSGNHKGIVIYGESHMDRSPCGTGTTAKMTLLHHLGFLKTGETYTNRGPLGTSFQGRLISETHIGPQPAVIAEITGSAQITGFHSFVLDECDPFPEGYLL